MVFKVNQNIFSLIYYQLGMELTSNRIAFCARSPKVFISRWNREDVSRGALKTVEVCRGESSNVSRVSSRLGLGSDPLLQSLIWATVGVCVYISTWVKTSCWNVIESKSSSGEGSHTDNVPSYTAPLWWSGTHIYIHSAITFTVNRKRQKLWHER